METATKIYQKGEFIFKQGEYASCMYDICQGKVGIIANYGEDGEKTLTELGEGASFGEMGMLEGYPRSATAVALEDGTEVRVVTAESVQLLRLRIRYRRTQTAADYGHCFAALKLSRLTERPRKIMQVFSLFNI